MIERKTDAVHMTVSQVEKQLLKVYSSLIQAKVPFKTFPAVMLWGPPGVGKDAAYALLTWSEMCDVLPNAEEVFEGNLNRIPNRPEIALALSAQIAEGIRNHQSPMEVKNALNYVFAMPQEYRGRILKDFLGVSQIRKILRMDERFCEWFMRSGREWDDYHWACDIRNYNQLIDLGWRVNSFSHLGKLQYVIPMYSGKVSDLTVYEILKRLPYRLHMLDEKTGRRYLTDSDYYWDDKCNDFFDGIVVLDIPKMTKYTDELKASEKFGVMGRDTEGEIIGVGEEIEDFWQNRIGKAVSIVREMGEKAGTIPAGIKREIEKSKKRVIDWKKVLNQFLQEEVTDYSFTPPDRRYADGGFFLPDFNEKDYTPKDILFMVDTSGSVRREDLSRVYAEITGAIEQFGGKLKGELGFFDCEVKPPIAFEDIEGMASIIPYGGGGTDFEVIFEYVREHLGNFLPAMIIIFTDGYASFPKQEAALNIPVLWLISNEHVTPPWGLVGRVTDL